MKSRINNQGMIFQNLEFLKESVCALSCSVLSDSVTSWTVAHQTSLCTRFSRQEYWRGLPFPPPGDLSDPGIESVSLVSPAFTGKFFCHWITWEAPLKNEDYELKEPALSQVKQTESESESHSVVSDSLQPHGLYSPWNSPGQNTGVGSLSLLQGIFLIQELNRNLLHCRQILYQLNYEKWKWKWSSSVMSDSLWPHGL